MRSNRWKKVFVDLPLFARSYLLVKGRLSDYTSSFSIMTQDPQVQTAIDEVFKKQCGKQEQYQRKKVEKKKNKLKM
ncbi:hypothetical protein L2E82_03874 [Cichorium intybus]|uniref:Uncharacterized protein n=1 Tax=Cichorium intybus TaxID=13427 RepID=A0ACB9H471_CICIN|nr:hypothetical protein L2E82_03874 [Cichorium intybus]